MALMQLVIPTCGRTNRQITLSYLPPELRKRTTLVCPAAEALQLSYAYPDVNIVEQPDHIKGIAEKRAWICKAWLEVTDKICMLDDDLTFSTRRSADGTRLRKIQGEELIPEFERLEQKLGPEFPHVGFGTRQFNNNAASDWKTPGKMVYCLGYFLPIVAREVEFGRVRTHEDQDISLQLLRKGYPNAIWNGTCVDQKKFGAPGGTSAERTIESANADCEILKQLHPGYVRVEKRGYKVSIPRKEVHVEWVKALRDGQQSK